MKIGLPQEQKRQEGRVALIPNACAQLHQRGHEIFVQANAGIKSGFSDADYIAAGCVILGNILAVYEQSELIVKVKEPIDTEVAMLRKDQVLFSYLHLAALPQLCAELQQIGLTAIGFETVTAPDGSLPLLTPMSSIAGRIAVQVSNTLLHHMSGGEGLLLGGVAGTPRGNVVVLGCGVAGGNAAQMAAALGANVTVFDKLPQKLEWARGIGPNVTALYAYPQQIADAVAAADCVIGAVLVPGAKAPVVVDRNTVAAMKNGSVIVDIAVDQGGCIETTHPTNYDAPTYVEEGVVHFAVTNMPGAVPRTASLALSAVLTPYVEILASGNWQQHIGLQAGINVQSGKVVHSGLLQP